MLLLPLARATYKTNAVLSSIEKNINCTRTMLLSMPRETENFLGSSRTLTSWTLYSTLNFHFCDDPSYYDALFASNFAKPRNVEQMTRFLENWQNCTQISQIFLPRHFLYACKRYPERTLEVHETIIRDDRAICRFAQRRS